MNEKVKSVQTVAEFACIHEGDKDYLLRLAAACREAGADAVKFQCFDPDEVVTPTHPDYQYLKSISFTERQWGDIIAQCSAMGLGVWIDLSGSFSVRVALAAGEALSGVKIHSSEIQNRTIMPAVRQLNRPVMIGCGGTPLIDLFELLDELGPACPVIFMHGFQSFPKKEGAKGGPPERGVGLKDLELWRIRQLAESFPMAKVGIAEHLSGEDPAAIQVPAMAVALGATMIEKHVTLDRAEQREDYFSALEPAEFRLMVAAVKTAAAAVGEDARQIGELEKGYQREMKRAAIAARDLAVGKKIELSDLELNRDGNYKYSVAAGRALGRSLVKPLAKGEMLTAAHLNLKVGVFCNARLASSRLPKKALLPFHDKDTTLGYLLRRLVSYGGNIGQVVLATTRLPEDAALEAIAKDVGVPCFRGEPEDVMGRMVETADAFGWDVLVRVTGDDQLVSCEYIEKALAYHLNNSLDYTRMNGLPIGMASEIIDVRTLKRVHQSVVNRQRTEHLTWYLDSDWLCRNGMIEAEPEHRYDKFRVTLDYQEDYELMREVVNRCHAKRGNGYIPIEDLIQELVRINPSWVHKETLWALTRKQVNTQLIYDYPKRQG